MRARAQAPPRATRRPSLAPQKGACIIRPMRVVLPPSLSLDPLVALFAAEPGVIAVWLFGSRARGDHRADSDVDVAVLAEDAGDENPLHRRFRWKVAAADALGVPDEAVDLVVLPEAPALLTHGILMEGRLLLDRDPDTRIEFQVRALHRAMEARHLREIAMRERARRYGVEP